MRAYTQAGLVILALFVFLVSCQGADVEVFNGIRGSVTDSSGTPVPSATVLLSSESVDDALTSQGTSTTLTDSTGSFSFELVGAGTYNITVVTNDGRGSYRASITFSGTGSLTINLEVTPVGAISGKALLGDRAEDSGGIDVYVPGTSFIAKTADNGNFTISGVPAGAYTLTAQHVGYLQVTVPEVTVVSGQTTVVGSTLVLNSENPTDPDPPGPALGRVSGSVGLEGDAPGGSTASIGHQLNVRGKPAVRSAGGTAKDTLPSLPLADASLDFVPGELIVGYQLLASADAAETFRAAAVLEAAGVRLNLVRSTPVLASGLYRAPGLSKDETLALARELAARPEVAYAEPNYIYQALAVPNDPLYGRQWHYERIDMESAWDITTGSSSVVVAVLDTGILYSSSDSDKRHPDFAGRLVPGYDFITDADFAMDGDGRDSDPFDSVEIEGYHGSHVAGTIGAASNNGVGVTGVDWQAKILPVRVLGDGGGTLADIRDGLVWAAGYGVPGVPTNTSPADVVNMSLGGASACSAAWQAAIDLVSEDVIVVVAAGNANVNASNFSPAGCAGVITVGATDRADERSWFSNYGSRIDVMAPGGDLDEDLDSDGFPDGVLSAGFNDNSSTFTYTYMQGTSMAAPHVAGVIALMKSIEPNLDRATALAALRASATPLSDAACHGYGASRTLTSIDCGAGLIDAFKAITYVDAGEIPDPVGAALTFTPSALEFGADTVRMDFQLTNIGGSPLDWELSTYQEAGDNPGEMLEGAFIIPDGSPNSGTLAGGASVSTAIVIDRSKLTAAGNYQIHLVFEIDGGVDEQLLLMRFSKTTTTKPTLSGPMLVVAYVENEFGELITSGQQTSSGVITDFSFEVLAGSNQVAAWSDENDNGLVDEGDFFGSYPISVNVPPGVEVKDLAITVAPVVGGGSLVDLNLGQALEAQIGAN